MRCDGKIEKASGHLTPTRVLNSVWQCGMCVLRVNAADGKSSGRREEELAREGGQEGGFPPALFSWQQSCRWF